MSADPFPENVIGVLEPILAAIPDIDKTFKRKLRPSDPHASLGVFSDTWLPEDMAIGQYDPAISVHRFGIQTFFKMANEEEGRRLHNLVSYRVRAVLYRDNGVHVGLAALNYTDQGITERYLKSGIRQQRYAANQIGSDFLFVSTAQFEITTEMV